MVFERVTRAFFFQAEDGIRDRNVTGVSDVCSSDLIRKVMAGIYTTLPLGVRTMRKIEAIVREEMDASGGQEIRMPIVLPAEPWKVTGRWQAYGDRSEERRVGKECRAGWSVGGGRKR